MIQYLHSAIWKEFTSVWQLSPSAKGKVISWHDMKVLVHPARKADWVADTGNVLTPEVVLQTQSEPWT